jgi:hypothetical protein
LPGADLFVGIFGHSRRVVGLLLHQLVDDFLEFERFVLRRRERELRHVQRFQFPLADRDDAVVAEQCGERCEEFRQAFAQLRVRERFELRLDALLRGLGDDDKRLDAGRIGDDGTFGQEAGKEVRLRFQLEQLAQEIERLGRHVAAAQRAAGHVGSRRNAADELVARLPDGCGGFLALRDQRDPLRHHPLERVDAVDDGALHVRERDHARHVERAQACDPVLEAFLLLGDLAGDRGARSFVLGGHQPRADASRRLVSSARRNDCTVAGMLRETMPVVVSPMVVKA